MEESQDSLIVINATESQFCDEGDEALFSLAEVDLSQDDSFMYVVKPDSLTTVTEPELLAITGKGNLEHCNNSLAVSDGNCSLIVMEPGMAYFDRPNARFEATEMSTMVPKFHSTPYLSPVTNFPPLSRDTSSAATMLEEPSNSLIILEDKSELPPTKRGRFESETNLHEENACCSHNCLSSFTASEQLDCLNFFRSMTISDQNQFLISSFQLMSNTGSSHIQHVIKGKAICRKAYIKMLKISEKRYQRNLKLFQTDPTVKYTRKEVSRRDSVKVSEAKAWMTRYFNRIGDSMPHMDQVHLPYGLTKRDVYYMMKGQLLEQGIDMVISLSHFYTVWDTSFKNVVIPKVSIILWHKNGEIMHGMFTLRFRV